MADGEQASRAEGMGARIAVNANISWRNHRSSCWISRSTRRPCIPALGSIVGRSACGVPGYEWVQLPGGRWTSEKDPGYPFLALAVAAPGSRSPGSTLMPPATPRPPPRSCAATQNRCGRCSTRSSGDGPDHTRSDLYWNNPFRTVRWKRAERHFLSSRLSSAECGAKFSGRKYSALVTTGITAVCGPSAQLHNFSGEVLWLGGRREKRPRDLFLLHQYAAD